MSGAFVDTSALYAVLDAADDHHPGAAAEWRRLLTAQVPLVTTNYVLLETTALLQHRLGLEAVRALERDILPVLAVQWVDESAHRAGMSAVLVAARRDVGLVDCVSFSTMRELGLHEVFAFDEHFAQQGFACLPSGSP
ncbi:MAG: PIN domain-containing protein [Candidatus Latescibacterota bacterium]